MARTKEEATGENGSPDASRIKAVQDAGVKKSGRGRGRPKKTEDGSSKPAPKVPTRPRGRPKGSKKKPDGGAATKPPKTPATPGEKRGRGRPPGSGGATPKAVTASAKKRGRKPKNPVSEENDDNDIDAEGDEPEVGDDAEHAETDSLAEGKSFKKASPPEDEMDGDDYDSSEE